MFHVGEIQRALLRRHRPSGDGQQAQAASGGVGGQAPPVIRVQRPHRVAHPFSLAHVEDALRRALQVDHRLARVVVVQGGHEAMLGLERNRIAAWPFRRQRLRIEAQLEAEAEQRAFGGVALQLPCLALLVQARLVAQQRRTTDLLQIVASGGIEAFAVVAETTQRSVAGAADLDHLVGGDDTLHGHLVAGQGAGLVRADHRHRTQRLHRRQAADDGVAPGHALYAEGEDHRHDRRQSLGNRRGGQRHHQHEHVHHRLALPEGAEDESGAGQQQDRQGQPATEAGDLSQQRSGQGADFAQQRTDPAQFGIPGGGDHHSARLAAGHQGAGIGHATAVAEQRVDGHRDAALLHRHRLAGQGRLVDMEVLRFEQPQVGRHPVAGGQQHHVARYQAFGVQRLALAVAQDQGMQRKHVADGVQRVGRLALLDETDQRVDHHRQEDYRTVHPEAEQRGDQRGEQHHVQQDVVELPQQAQQRPLAFRRGQPVVAVRRQAAGGLVRVQAGGGAVQSFQHPLRRAGMGVAGRQGWDAVHGIPAPRSDEQNYRAGLRRNV